MPTVRVAIWNIQNYGAGNPARKWGANSALRNQFIALAVRQLNVQVLFIQEVSVNALPSLQDLATRLNVGGVTDWAVSFCGSALTSTAANPPADNTELTFRTDGRSEGYAVCWRSNNPAYTTVNGATQIAEVHPPITNVGNPAAPARTPLNLVTNGRPVGSVNIYLQQGRKRKLVEEEINAVGGYLRPNLVPYGEDNQLMASWPLLDFPTTSTRNPRELTWEKVRRPAFIVLNLNTGGVNPEENLMPVIAYHAPSNKHKAGWGALLSGLSRELCVVDGVDVNNDPDVANSVSMRRTVLGGDFNYAVDSVSWPAEYMYFTKDLARTEKGGALCRYAPLSTLGNARLTTIQLFDIDNQTPINSANLTAYYRYPIDLIFFRGFPANQSSGRRVDIPDILLNNGLPYAAVLQAFDVHLTALVGALAGPFQRMDPGNTGPQEWVNGAWKAMLCGNYGGTFLHWGNFLADLNNGQMTNARRTAEFYQIFISDHLPVLCEINF